MKPLIKHAKLHHNRPALNNFSLFIENYVVMEIWNVIDEILNEVNNPTVGQLIDTLSVVWYNKGNSKE